MNPFFFFFNQSERSPNANALTTAPSEKEDAGESLHLGNREVLGLAVAVDSSCFIVQYENAAYLLLKERCSKPAPAFYNTFHYKEGAVDSSLTKPNTPTGSILLYF